MVDHYQTIRENFKRLTVYGCSHSAGTELSDHIALGISLEDCNRLKKQTGSMTKFYEHYHNGVQVSQIFKNFNIDQTNKDFSYTASLAKKLNLECDNRSMPGNSLPHMYWELIRDFYQGKINNKDLVLIGCTHIERILLMQKNTDNKLITQGVPISFADPKISKASIILNSIEKLIWDYYHTLQMFEIFASRNNITLMIVPTASPDINVLHPNGWLYDQLEIDTIVKYHIIKIWKSLRSTIMISDLGIEDFLTPIGKSGWQHCPKICHDAYANHLFEQLKLFGNFIRI